MQSSHLLGCVRTRKRTQHTVPAFTILRTGQLVFFVLNSRRLSLPPARNVCVRLLRINTRNVAAATCCKIRTFPRLLGLRWTSSPYSYHVLLAGAACLVSSCINDESRAASPAARMLAGNATIERADPIQVNVSRGDLWYL